MDSASYSYNATEHHPRFLPANPATEPRGRRHRSISHSYPQLPHPSELLHTIESTPDHFSYQLPPLRGFNLSHLRQESGLSQEVEARSTISSPGTFEAFRGPRLRRQVPSISRRSLIRPADNFGLPDIAVDPQLLPALQPPQPPRVLPSIEYDQWQRPTNVRLSDMQPPFDFRPSQPLSHLACIYPFSSPPPIPPRNISTSPPIRRRPQQLPSFLRDHNSLRRLVPNTSSTEPPTSDFLPDRASAGQAPVTPRSGLIQNEDILTAPLHQSSIAKREDLPEEYRICMICYNEYESKSEHFYNEDIYEQAVKAFDCRHIFGHKCIQKWLMYNKTCPYCRVGVLKQQRSP